MPKPKLTLEEKKALKLLKKQQKIEQQRQDKRDWLTREKKYGSITVKRHEKKWREMLMKITSISMKKDLEYLWHNFERTIDAKDFTISLLMDQLNQSENQYLLNVKAHMEHIDNLIKLFGNQMDDMQRDFYEQINKIHGNNAEEMGIINSTASENEEYLRTMLYCLDVARQEQEATNRADYYSKYDDQQSKYRDFIAKMKSDLEQKFKQILDETVNFAKNYDQQTRKRKEEQKTLTEQDDQLQALLVKQLEQTRQSTELIRKLRQQLNLMQRVDGDKLLNLEREKIFYEETCTEMKDKINATCKIDAENLTMLTGYANDTVGLLEHNGDLGEKILRFLEICRKLETEQEKILPFPMPDRKVALKDADKVESRCSYLDFFWQKVGQVNASVQMMDEEKWFLVKENGELRLKLKDFCDGLSLQPTKLKNVNKAKPVAVDGAFEMRKYNVFRKFD